MKRDMYRVKAFDKEDIDYKEYMIRLINRDNSFIRFVAGSEINYELYLRVIKPNNWLRLHGYPMRRKVRIKKHG